MCYKITDSTFGSITAVNIGGDELILGLPSDFDHLFVCSTIFIVHDLEVEVVATACQPFHYGVVRRNTVSISAHFVG